MPKKLTNVSKDLKILIKEVSQNVFQSSNEENDDIVRRVICEILGNEKNLSTFRRISESTTRERTSSTGSRKSDSSNDGQISTTRRCFGCGESFSSCYCQRCEFCAKPVAVMGNSRHHCRKCGAALCSKCWIRRTDDGLWKVCRFSDACEQRLIESREKKSKNVSNTTRTVSTSRRYKWKRFLTSNTTSKVVSNTSNTTRQQHITSKIVREQQNTDHHVTRISVLPKEIEEENQPGTPTREQQKLASRMSKFVGVTDSSHLARALLRNDDDDDSSER